MRGLGWERLILPFNEALGDTRDLPFDLEKNRLLRFRTDAENDQPEVLRALTDDFRRAVRAILGLCSARDLVVQWLEETNPMILNALRSGHQTVYVNVSAYRVGSLMALRKLRGIDTLVEFRSNGSLLANETCSNGGINDLAGSQMNGYVFTFKGDPAEW